MVVQPAPSALCARSAVADTVRMSTKNINSTYKCSLQPKPLTVHETWEFHAATKGACQGYTDIVSANHEWQYRRLQDTQRQFIELPIATAFGGYVYVLRTVS
jgi:hypothetical protein